MGVIDDFRQEKNKIAINMATEKMIMDKYNINIDKLELRGIIEQVIISICNDAILIKRIGKLIELNTIALTKIKDYIENNIINKNTKNTDDNELKTAEEIIDNINKYNTEELLSKVIELEEKRKTVNTLASSEKKAANAANAAIENININISSVPAQTATTNASAQGTVGADTDASSTLSFQPIQTSQKYSLVNNVNAENLETIAYIIEKMESIMNNKKNINYKSLIINSYNRDWTIYNNRNNLSLSINIDLTKNIIEPKKLLMPKYVKSITPYITMTINDGKKSQRFQFILGTTTAATAAATVAATAATAATAEAVVAATAWADPAHLRTLLLLTAPQALSGTPEAVTSAAGAETQANKVAPAGRHSRRYRLLPSVACVSRPVCAGRRRGVFFVQA